jgi:glycosyltransferase involved in cell wall biosynthesis
MSFNPLVSIIIPHFNRSDLLKETLASVYRQTFSDWEVIVVDDGSNDTELAVIRGLANDRTKLLVRNDGTKGPSRCRNLGAKEAKGTYLVFLDSDDLLAPWCLQSRVNLISKHSVTDAVVLPVAFFTRQPGDQRNYWNDLAGGDDIERFLVSDPVWHTSSPLWKKESFQRIGGFNEKVMYGDDSELHLRSLLQNVLFSKFANEVPDAFVRRADQERITGTINGALIASRRIRLAEGSDVIEAHGSREYCQLWQSQYVDECEFLLFNAPKEKAACDVILQDWYERWPSYRTHQNIFRLYMTIAWLSIGRNRLGVRLARRLAILFSPQYFFPKRRTLKTQISDAMADLLKQKLS